eukprot:6150297-Pyramimonas_sp.AAC.1
MALDDAPLAGPPWERRWQAQVRSSLCGGKWMLQHFARWRCLFAALLGMRLKWGTGCGRLRGVVNSIAPS